MILFSSEMLLSCDYLKYLRFPNDICEDNKVHATQDSWDFSVSKW